MKLFPSVIISLKKDPLRDPPSSKEGPIIGNKITATTLKNRSYPPYQTSTVMIDYKDGVQPYAGIIDIGLDADLIQLKGSWYKYKGENIGQGFLNATKALAENEDGFEGLLKDIDTMLANTGYSSVSEEVQQAEELLQEEEEAQEPKKLKTVKEK